MGLNGVEVAMLEFERGWWKHAGAREAAIRDRFGMSPASYAVTLAALLERPEALEHDAVLVRRLLRLRAARRAQRSATRLDGVAAAAG